MVIVASLLPSESAPIRALELLDLSDKVEHTVAYAALALLPAIHERRKFVIGAAAAAVVLGIVLEYGQLYTGWRDFEVADMVADTIGVCVGLAFGLLLRNAKLTRSVLTHGVAKGK